MTVENDTTGLSRKPFKSALRLPNYSAMVLSIQLDRYEFRSVSL